MNEFLDSDSESSEEEEQVDDDQGLKDGAPSRKQTKQTKTMVANWYKEKPKSKFLSLDKFYTMLKSTHLNNHRRNHKHKKHKKSKELEQ